LNFISLALKEIRNDQQVVFVYDSSWWTISSYFYLFYNRVDNFNPMVDFWFWNRCRKKLYFFIFN
jgi:hypothetical protein